MGGAGRGAATRSALLEAMERLLAREGLAACTSTAVAAEAGFAAGTFYRYFSDRGGALAELFAQRLDATIDAVAATLTSDRLLDDGLAPTLDAAVGVVIDRYREHAPVLRAALASVQNDEAIRRAYWDRHRRSVALIERFLRRAATAGLVHPDPGPALAQTLLLMLQGLNSPVVLSAADADLAAGIRAHVVEALVAMLTGRIGE